MQFVLNQVQTRLHYLELILAFRLCRRLQEFIVKTKATYCNVGNAQAIMIDNNKEKENETYKGSGCEIASDAIVGVVRQHNPRTMLETA